ncbi:MAG: HD domain-containing protein [Deltaproteobacteria bacterium]|nr:HD domain-containing protein [Deltaproteobacteria bacterium]
MISPDMQDAILKSINAAMKSKKLYPPGHPAIAAPSKKSYDLLTDVLKTQKNLMIGNVNDALVFEDHPVSNGEQMFPELLAHLADKQVDAVIFEKGVTEKELFSLFDTLAGQDAPKGQELHKLLHAKGVTHITLKTVRKKIVEIYNGAVETVKNVMNDVRLGKIPKSEPVNDVVNELTESVLSDANAIIGLTMIKNYDNYLYNHSVNVSIIALSLGKAMNIDRDELHAVGIGALLHDIGKTGVSEQIIRKPGGLSSDEWEKIKEHPLLGSNIIKRMDGMTELIGKLIYEHHIRFDHSGYPQTMSNLHPLTQIITISDAFDALTTLRVYQQPHNPAEALRVMLNFSGRHFNPDALNVFINMIGTYPVGTLVRLSSNEIGVVTSVNKDALELPAIKLLFDKNGEALPAPVPLDLAADSSRSVISTVNPTTADIDLAAFFEKEGAEKEHAA